MPAAVWDSRPDLQPWCAKVAEQAARWQPDPALGTERDRIVEAVERAAAATELWLMHPCLNRLTSSRGYHRLERDVRFMTWVAAHADVPLGVFTIDRLSWRWSAAGSAIAIPPGRHDLHQLVADDTVAGERGISLDPYCRSTGFPLPQCWSESSTGTEASLLAMTARETSHALALLARWLPGCAEWAKGVTRVIVPLPDGGSMSASGSEPDIPGLIQLATLNGPVAALEGLVHESAHHHFTTTETAGELVDPEHRDLYRSPLRAEPRPLRNVFLAVHALCYIVAFYDDGLHCGLLSPDWAKRRDDLMLRLEQGLASLASGRAHMTSRGEQLFGSLPAAAGPRD